MTVKKEIRRTKQERREERWHLHREQILLFFGLGLIAFEAINAEIRGGPFHYEFLICGSALCGVALARWGDNRNR